MIKKWSDEVISSLGAIKDNYFTDKFILLGLLYSSRIWKVI